MLVSHCRMRYSEVKERGRKEGCLSHQTIRRSDIDAFDPSKNRLLEGVSILCFQSVTAKSNRSSDELEMP
jgi:hypothetical protein